MLFSMGYLMWHCTYIEKVMQFGGKLIKTEKNSENEILKGLSDHHQLIKGWLQDVEKKIAELEDSYLDDTTFGNAARGWDAENKNVPPRFKLTDEREKVFSRSSYHVWMESRSLVENEAGGILTEKKAMNPRVDSQNTRNKKSRKSSFVKRESDTYFEDYDEEYV